MIVKRITAEQAPIYTVSNAAKIGIDKLLLTSEFGKVFITDEDNVLLGYYSFEHYKNNGTYDMQSDAACLQEDKLQQFEGFATMSTEGTDHGILPIVSANGNIVGAAICTDDSWQDDRTYCFSKLEYLSEKEMSLEYWFLANNYRKVAFWGLDELSLAFANEIRHYQGIELLGIYDKRDHRLAKTIDRYIQINYIVNVKFVQSVKDAVEAGADLVIVTDQSLRFLEEYPSVANVHTDVIYAPRILNINPAARGALKGDITPYVNTEMFNRCKAKYRALGCNFLTVSVPDIVDLNIRKDAKMFNDNAGKMLWVANRNGWETESNEAKEFSKGFELMLRSTVIKDGKQYLSDIKSKYINIVNRSRAVLNNPAEYKNTIYIVGSCIVGGFYCTDEQTIGYYLQENINARGLKYRVVPVFASNGSDRYYFMKVLEDHNIREGDKIFLLDFIFMLTEWDLDLTPTIKELIEKYGYDFFIDRPMHCGKEGSKAIADFLIDHISDPFVPDTDLTAQTQTVVNPPRLQNNPQLKNYQEFIQSSAIHKIPKIGSIVMNCNPFTLGHRYLVEYAAGQVDYLYIFVVEEDKSFFKFEDRLELVKAGTAHLKNVKVFPSGQFIISSVTFSEYFDKENLDGTAVDTSLDVETFGSQIAPCLNITVRFVGEEPLDPVTAQYNRNMKEILPKYGIELHEIPRKEIDGNVISASRVRKLLEEKNWNEIKKLVPKTTYSFLRKNYG